MVKIKKPISVAPSKAVPLKKTIKKKHQEKSAGKQLTGEEEPGPPHVPMVALAKHAEKLQVPGKKVKQIIETAKNTKIEIKTENGKKSSEVKQKSKTTKKMLQTQTNKYNGGKIEKPNLNKKKQKLAQKLSSDAFVNVVDQTIKKKGQKNKKPSSKSEEKEFSVDEIISTEELPKFDEEDFFSIVNLTNIKKIAKSLKTIVEGEVSKKTNSLFTDYRYFLNVSSFKIADCPKRMVKLNLKHSLLNKENDDVLIIVHDLKRGAKVDYEPTIQHYTDMFREHNVDELGYRLTIMPFNQLRQEHKTFEAKRKLAATYEHYLCDSRVIGHAVGCVGKKFQKPRTTFHAVHLDKIEKLKVRINRALHRTAYKQLHKGDMISIPVGNHNFTIQQLSENVQFVVEQLKEMYAGGYANIRSMNLKIDLAGTSSLPIFISNCRAPVQTPYVVGPKEKRLLNLKRDANAVLQKFDLDKNGLIKPLSKKQTEKKQTTIEYRKKMLEVLEGKEKNQTNGKPAKKAKLEIKKKSLKAEEDNDDDEDEDEHVELEDDD